MSVYEFHHSAKNVFSTPLLFASLFCGNWGRGGVMELLPHGGARLSGPRYETPFEGLRELRLPGSEHHVHLDLGRLTRACYVMAPSVCYGFRPSFELRLTAANTDPDDGCGFGLALSHPYAGGDLQVEPVQRYFRRAAEHIEKFPGAVSFRCDRVRAPPVTRGDWSCVESLLTKADMVSAHSMRPLQTELQRSLRAAVTLA